jgi:pilus assembly protein CpaE
MVVSFLGTKGGTGTTTLAVNSGADLRRITGRPTIAVDLTSGPGDVALFLGLRPRYTLLTAIDQMAWTEPGELGRYVTMHECGLHVLAAGGEFGRPGQRDAEAVEKTLTHLSAAYDFVVVDAGNTLTPAAVVGLRLSDVVMVVANPDVPCLRNLQRVLDAVKLVGVARERLRIVLNRASEFGVLSGAQIEKVLGVNLDYCIGSDYRTMASAVNAGVPVSSLRSSELQPQLEHIARSLAESALAA